MNMRFSNAFETLPGRVQDVPRRFRLLPSRTKLIGGAVAVVVLAGLLFLIFGGNTTKERNRPTPLVVTATATKKDVTVVEHAVGTVVANATVQVTAQVTGQLLRTGFREGQIVRKGDLLFVIDPRPFEAALLQAKAQLAKDTAQQTNAESNKRRYDALFAQNAISSQQRDEADASAKSYLAMINSDRAAVQMAQINLGYTQIRSPVDGKTGPILIQPGNLVAANGSNPLVVITQIEPVKISFALPQSYLAAIQARDRAGKLVAMLDTHEPKAPKLSAKVDFISNEVSNLSGTIELRANFDNKDHRLVPGQQVDVDVALDNLPKATVVPREAVNEGPTGRYVFVVAADETAEMRPVAVLYDDGAMMAVRGIKEKERVVVDGQLRVLPGGKVTTGKGRKTAKTP